MRLRWNRFNGHSDVLSKQSKKFDLLLEEAKQLYQGARERREALGNTEQGTEYKVGPARGEDK